MTRHISVEERRARLARRHRLLPGMRVDDVVAISDGLVAFHSTDPVTVYLSAAARMNNPTLNALESAMYNDRSLIRHHAMRRTLWVGSPTVMRLAHAAATEALIGPEHRRTVKMLEDAGLTSDGNAWMANAKVDVLSALSRLGTASTRELGQQVPELKLAIPTAVGKPYSGTIAAHTRVMLQLGFQADIVRVRPTGNSIVNAEYRWTSMRDWLPDGLAGADTKQAAGELAHRWLQAFGPATTTDLQWWMGWTLGLTKHALAAANAEPVATDEGAAWVAEGDNEPVGPVEPWVALLPGLDPTTMGWKQRDWYLPAETVPHVFDRNGNGGPAIWVDGRIVGGWVQRKDGSVATKLLTDPGRDVTAGIAERVAMIEALLGETRFTVRFSAPMQTALLNA